MNRMKRPGRVAPRTGSKEHSHSDGDVLTRFLHPGLGVAPPTHFACASCYSKGKRHRIAIWNGVRDFACPPPPALIEYMEMSGKIIIKQINRPLWEGGTSAVETCNNLVRNHLCDNVVFWACNERVYESIKAEFKIAEQICFHPTAQ